MIKKKTMKTPIIASITTLIIITLLLMYFYNDLKDKPVNINLSLLTSTTTTF